MNAARTQEIMFGAFGSVADPDSSSGQLIRVDGTDFPPLAPGDIQVFEATSSDDSTPVNATFGSTSAYGQDPSLTASVAGGSGNPSTIVLDGPPPITFYPGRRYTITHPGTYASETFEVIRLDVDTLHLRAPLRGTYAVGSSVAEAPGAYVNARLGWVTDEANLSTGANPNPRYRVKWTYYDVNGNKVAVYRGLDLVRYSSAAPVGPIDIDDAFPGWLDSLPPDHQLNQGRSLIDEAARAVRLDLYRAGIAERTLRNAEAHAALVIDHAILSSMEARGMHGADVTQMLAIAKDRYTRRLASLVESPVLAVDTSGSGGTTTSTARSMPLWVR